METGEEEPEWTSEDTGEEDREGGEERELESPAFERLGLGDFVELAKDVFTDGKFSFSATPVNYMHSDTPPSLPFRPCTREFLVTAHHRQIELGAIKGFPPGQFWFSLSFEHNGYDLRNVRLRALPERSGPKTVNSNFSITFSGQAYSVPSDPIAEVIFQISGTWDPFGSDSFDIKGSLWVRADGSVRLKVTDGDEKGWVRLEKITGTCETIQPPAPPVPSFEVVFFSPSGSWTLKRGDNQKLLAWWDKLPAAIRERITAGQLPISIHAYASTKGKTRSNLILSKKRTEAVKEILIGEAGYGADFRIFPHGEMRAGTPDRVESEKERRAIVEVIF